MAAKERWNERYAEKELVWSMGPNQLFAEHVDGLKSGRALDVASGEGRNAIWLAEQGWKVDAIDFSDVGIEKAREIADRRMVSVNWIVADVCDYNFPVDHYDLAAVLYLHTPRQEREQWFPGLIRSVAPGGRFVYIGHDQRNITEGVGGPQDASLLATVDELLVYLDGFNIEVAEVYERPTGSDPGHGGEGRALDTFVIAVKDSQ
jgi:SAM-dependent methyltransferase